MLRYIFLSVFALLLLTACGGNDVDRLTKNGECVECDLSGVDLPDSSLINADLSNANLSHADLTEADLTEADLTEADLTEADLTGTNLNGADLNGADLTGADLTGANLTIAHLDRAKSVESMAQAVERQVGQVVSYSVIKLVINSVIKF